ncbi:MAG: class I SAM-dependent methyltransferase, partial [Oscillospiraceae bacterium]|nr:class I SAM-dependent methyltransferase [Oscillospiraceae bacterium]
MTEDTKLYALETLGSIKNELIYLAEQASARRAELYKYLSSDKEYARDIHSALQNALNEIQNRVNEARLCLLELGEPAAATAAGKLASSLNTFNPLTRDYTPFRKAVTAFAESLPSRETVSAAVIGRMMGYVRMGYYPTDEANLEHILRGISFPDGVVTNLLDPCCGEGRALKKLAVGNNCMTYGAELDEARAEKAQTELHRVAFGDYFRSHMSRDAFHLLFLNPPYLAVT